MSAACPTSDPATCACSSSSVARCFGEYWKHRGIWLVTPCSGGLQVWKRVPMAARELCGEQKNTSHFIVPASALDLCFASFIFHQITTVGSVDTESCSEHDLITVLNSLNCTATWSMIRQE
ncbi:hypothetical protein BP00DRAFT_32750 [Aspergillus indologenus CBS 114.80]|uniref:Uncharacterized protein n=1 Tax=Aspergillus indologenus CBS 114.80 TaxID=1450541 RepID=A0A2V5HRR8_9EURO|nr:hypothetical protein BP00DRAFT_32750 [Aspergillus indologenus CBS 114.80]